VINIEEAPIVECFESIQCEGKNLGVPSIFVRFYGCNLRCQFKGIECDTPYAVYKEKDNAIKMTVLEVYNKIKSFKSKNIVWTGGEPCLFQDFIINVMYKLNRSIMSVKKKDFYTAEIETNGTIVIKSALLSHIELFNISVKLSSSNQLKGFNKLRINHDALESFPDSRKYSYEIESVFKFVYSNENDIKEILDLNKKYPTFPIYLMPEGITREDVLNNSLEVVDKCIEYGFRFSPREHINIWDTKRSV